MEFCGAESGLSHSRPGAESQTLAPASTRTCHFTGHAFVFLPPQTTGHYVNVKIVTAVSVVDVGSEFLVPGT